MKTEKYIILTLLLMIMPAITCITFQYLPKKMKNWIQRKKLSPLCLMILFILLFAMSCYEF